MKRVLPASAFDYARSRLWQARDLEEPLLHELQEGEFTAWTLADEAIPDARLEEYETGGLAERRDLSSEVASHAVEVMQRSAEATWTAPDSLARPGDPFLETIEGDHFVVGDAIYYVVEHPDEGRVRDSWQRAGSAAGQVAIVSYCGFPADPTPENLSVLAATAQLVVVTAYDGEGAIYLERHEARTP